MEGEIRLQDEKRSWTKVYRMNREGEKRFTGRIEKEN